MTKLAIALVLSSMIISASLIYSQDQYEIHPCQKDKGEMFDGLRFCHLIFNKKTAKIYQYNLSINKENPPEIMERDIISKTVEIHELKWKEVSSPSN